MSSPKEIKNPRLIKIMRELKKSLEDEIQEIHKIEELEIENLVLKEKEKINKINALEEDLRIETISFQNKK